MPSSRARTCTNRILRDYLVAALPRCPHPLTTTQLRQGAPLVALQGSARPLPPTQETIYRLLRSLEGEGAITTADTTAYARAWTTTPNPAAAHEIAALDALFSAPARLNHDIARFDSCRRRR